MKIHPRTKIFQEARNQFHEFLLNLEQKHELTLGEILHLLGGEVAHFATYQIRYERHPDNPDKRGDEV
jgi:hypothetical protein